MSNSVWLMLEQNAALGMTVFLLLGLAIGSFLNVVIYRLPVMMKAQWQTECADLQGTEPPDAPVFNLWKPRSQCRACHHTLTWRENLPLISFVMQSGRCRHCAEPISMRYPLVELATALLFAFCAWRWGFGITAASWSCFLAALLALALIDWDTTYLPDSITLPLLWGGLLAAWAGITPVSTEDAVAGAAAGYGFLWAIFWGFKLITGKEGMGYGDFKLLAALGAWLGWQSLIPIILIASVIGTIVGLVLKVRAQLREGGYVPFGPFLAGAGVVALLMDPVTLFRLMGLP